MQATQGVGVLFAKAIAREIAHLFVENVLAWGGGVSCHF
jgi:hypothetical protein